MLVQLCKDSIQIMPLEQLVPQLVLKGQPDVPLVALASLLGTTLVAAVVVYFPGTLGIMVPVPS